MEALYRWPSLPETNIRVLSATSAVPPAGSSLWLRRALSVSTRYSAVAWPSGCTVTNRSEEADPTRARISPRYLSDFRMAAIYPLTSAHTSS